MAETIVSVTLTDSEIKKDSRQSWFVCIAASLLVGISMVVNNSFGVLFVNLVDEFDGGRTKIAWIGSFELIWHMGISPVCHTLTQSFGFRRVVFVGGTFFFLGLLTTSFASDIRLIYITYGLLFGTGTCLLFIPSVTVLPYCFQTHLSTAWGIAISTGTLFVLWFGPIYEYLMRKYGWRLALKILMVLIVPVGIACAFFPKKGQVSFNEGKESKTKPSSSLLRVLRNQAFVLWIFIMFLVYLGLMIPIVYLVSFSKDIGIPTKIGVYSISILCVSDGLGKLVVGRLLDYFHWDIFAVNSIALLTMAVAVNFLPLATTHVHLFLIASVYGMAFGTQSLCVYIISSQLCHPKDAKRAVTYLFAALGIPGAVGSVLAALIYDLTQSYRLAFFIAGGLFACASCLAVLLPFFNRKSVLCVQETRL